MAREIKFRVTNRLTENTGQAVLVYLAPFVGKTTENYFLSAWQVLNPSANGGRQSFVFSDRHQLFVENQNTLSESMTVQVRPNQLYTVTNSFNQGPVLHLSHSRTAPSAILTAVQNTTDPPITLKAIWMVDDKAVLVQEGINLDATASIEFNPTLFFVVVLSPGNGSPALVQFSQEQAFTPPLPGLFGNSGFTGYDVPGGTDQVEVSWVRPGGINGADTLIFDPPSAAHPSFRR